MKYEHNRLSIEEKISLVCAAGLIALIGWGALKHRGEMRVYYETRHEIGTNYYHTNDTNLYKYGK